MILTWGYAGICWPREGRSGAMFAPRLLVSPDLVPRAPQTASQPPVPPGLLRRPGRSISLQRGPTDDITQRDACRIAQLKDSGPRPRAHARSTGGTREVHRVGVAAGLRRPVAVRTGVANLVSSPSWRAQPSVGAPVRGTRGQPRALPSPGHCGWSPWPAGPPPWPR